MFDKLFSFLGFNPSQSYIGLTKLVDSNLKTKPVVRTVSKKELKLSDLMRGN